MNVWFEYPVHHVDRSGVLADIQPEAAAGVRRQKGRKKSPQDKLREQQMELENALAMVDEKGSGEVRIAELQRYLNLSKNTVKTRIDDHPDFERDRNGIVRRCQAEEEV